jgi:hypothetical protein
MSKPTEKTNNELRDRVGMMLRTLPFEIEKWLITIKAHCTVIADPSPTDDVRELTECIKNNADHDLRPAILALLDDRDRLRLLSHKIDMAGKQLLDALLIRFPDLKEYPDLIHHTDIGKGLLKAIREFHLAWADLGAEIILKMSNEQALAALAKTGKG